MSCVQCITICHTDGGRERIDPGNRTWTLATTPKVVSGIDAGSLAAVEGFYAGIVDQTVAVSSPREAELANDINSHMPDYVVRRLLLALNQRKLPVSGSRILLLGLAYKKNTGDARESPAIRIADLLLGMGADVRAADPLVTETGVPRLTSWCCSPTTTPSAPLTSAATRVTCSTAGGCCPARTSRPCESHLRSGVLSSFHIGQATWCAD